MLYKTIFLAVGLLATAQLSAQNFSLGVRAGYSLSDLNYRGQYAADFAATFADAQESLSGFHAGVESRVELGKRFALLSGLQYARKGYATTLARPGGLFEDVNYVLHYINVPIAGSFRIWKGLSVQAGLEAEYLLGSQGKTATETFDAEGFVDQYNDFDLGVLGGLEYQFGRNFFVGVRHTIGITPLSNLILANNNGQNLGTVRTYNTSTQFSAGYRYYFGK